MNNIRDGIIWWASEHQKSSEELANKLTGVSDAALHRTLAKLAAEHPDLIERLTAEEKEGDEFTCSEYPDHLRMPNPWGPGHPITHPPSSTPMEVLWWPLYDVRPVPSDYGGEATFFAAPAGRSDHETNDYCAGRMPPGNHFALYEVELRFKNPPSFAHFVLRMDVGDKVYLIAPSDNMWRKQSVLYCYSIAVVAPIYLKPQVPFRIGARFYGQAPGSVPNAVRCILNGYRARTLI